MTKLIETVTDLEDPEARQIWVEKLSQVLTIPDWREIGNTGEPAFATSWANFNTLTNTSAAFYKDPYNRVHLKGVVTRTSGSTVFTLPSGYRPTERYLFSAVGDGAVALINVELDGDVTLGGGTAASYLSLDGISFRV